MKNKVAFLLVLAGTCTDIKPLTWFCTREEKLNPPIAVTSYQTKVASPLPATCEVGDFADSYRYGSACIAKNKWLYYAGGYGSGDGDGATAWGSEPTWRPNCSWAFKDAAGNFHCPYETASGRVVACIPCGSKDGVDCARWYQRCLRRVELMKTHETVEATANTIPKEEQTDHTKSVQYHYSCPEGFKLNWLGEHAEWGSPICAKP